MLILPLLILRMEKMKGDIKELQEGENKDNGNDVIGFDAVFVGSYMQYQNKKKLPKKKDKQ